MPQTSPSAPRGLLPTRADLQPSALFRFLRIPFHLHLPNTVTALITSIAIESARLFESQDRRGITKVASDPFHTRARTSNLVLCQLQLQGHAQRSKMKIDASMIESECKCLKRAKMNDETKALTAGRRPGWRGGKTQRRRRAGRRKKGEQKESKGESSIEG